MSVESSMSGHWTDEQLISYLYGIGPEDKHIEECVGCQQRVSALQASRRELEAECAPGDEVSTEFLAAQRRNIYARLSPRSSWWSASQTRSWASAAATVLILGGGLFFYEENHARQTTSRDRVSDVQLAQEMSQISQDVEPEPAAPLQALFDE